MTALGDWLNERRQQMSTQEGRAYDEPLSWETLADRCNRLAGYPVIHFNSLRRWERGLGMPSTFEQIMALSKVFGESIFDVLGYPAPVPQNDPDLQFLFRHRNDPNVRALLREVVERARQQQELQKAPAHPTRAATQPG